MRLRSLILYLEAKLFEDKVGIIFTSIDTVQIFV